MKLLFLVLSATISSANGLSAKKIVEQAEFNLRGSSLQGQAQMIIKNEDYERSMKISIKTKGFDYGLVRILEPQKEKGNTTLRRKLDLWQYLPKVNRVIRIPSSLMLQSWMGSDFSNDDLVKASSLSNDYIHQLIGEEKISGLTTYRILLTPKKDSPVVWGKIELWVTKSDSGLVKEEYFSETGEKVKVLSVAQLKTFGQRTVPVDFTMISLGKKKSKTQIIYNLQTIKVDEAIPDSVFTESSMKKL